MRFDTFTKFTMNARHVLFAACLALLIQDEAGANPLTARESDPRVMGWMKGFPPASEKIITQPDSEYFSFPKLRWSVCHLREFLPTKRISRGLGAPKPLDYLPAREFADMRDAIDGLAFTPMNGGGEMSWRKSLYENYTDGLLIIHRGQVVYERYFGCLEEDGVHAAMSMTKSVTGLLAEIMVVEGALDETALVSDLVPEIGDSAFATATVRQVMDMTTGGKYSEDYADPDADIWLYSAVVGWTSTRRVYQCSVWVEVGRGDNVFTLLVSTGNIGPLVTCTITTVLVIAVSC